MSLFFLFACFNLFSSPFFRLFFFSLHFSLRMCSARYRALIFLTFICELIFPIEEGCIIFFIIFFFWPEKETKEKRKWPLFFGRIGWGKWNYIRVVKKAVTTMEIEILFALLFCIGKSFVRMIDMFLFFSVQRQILDIFLVQLIIRRRLCIEFLYVKSNFSNQH